MTSAIAQPAGAVQAPAFGRLYLSEVRRFLGRRLIKLLLILLLVGYLIAIGSIWHTYHRPTASDRAAAVAQRDADYKRYSREYAQCIKTTPQAQVDAQCPSAPPSIDEMDAANYMTVRPLVPDAVRTVAIALGVATAAIGFLAAATFIGAEWSSRNIVALLWWEPRRLRLLAAKILALLSVMLAVAALVQLTWAGIGRVLLHYRGTPISALGAHASRFSSDLAWVQLRSALLVLAFALLAFCIAQLLRNTSAALGFGFLYFAVVENAVRILRASWEPYLLSSNTGAWVNTGGITVNVGQRFDGRTNTYTEHLVHLSNLRGAITILIYVGIALAPALVGFRRRDIT